MKWQFCDNVTEDEVEQWHFNCSLDNRYDIKSKQTNLFLSFGYHINKTYYYKQANNTTFRELNSLRVNFLLMGSFRWN